MGAHAMIVPFFDLGRVTRAEKDELHRSLDHVLDNGYFVGGPEVSRFEESFRQFVGSEYALGVGNGLDAIRLLLEAYGVGEGDEVIVPAFTYYATWLGVTQTGAKLIPVDVNLLTANIDASKVEEAITPKTKAIFAVHLYGQGADMAPLQIIAKKHNLLLLEDVAQSHGAMSNAGKTGASGDGAAFSFYPTKNLGALGDGGGVTTSNPDVYEKIKSRRSYGQGATKYDHIDTGWNSRLDPLQAAFLGIHLAKLEAWNKKRSDIAAQYLDAIGTENHRAVIGIHSPCSSVWHHFVIRSSQREQLQEFFSANGVTTDIHYPYSILEVSPMAQFISGSSQEIFPNASSLSKQVLSLPMGPWMEAQEISYVADVLRIMDKNLLAI